MMENLENLSKFAHQQAMPESPRVSADASANQYSVRTSDLPRSSLMSNYQEQTINIRKAKQEVTSNGVATNPIQNNLDNKGSNSHNQTNILWHNQHHQPDISTTKHENQLGSYSLSYNLNSTGYNSTDTTTNEYINHYYDDKTTHFYPATYQHHSNQHSFHHPPHQNQNYGYPLYNHCSNNTNFSAQTYWSSSNTITTTNPQSNRQSMNNNIQYNHHSYNTCYYHHTSHQDFTNQQQENVHERLNYSHNQQHNLPVTNYARSVMSFDTTHQTEATSVQAQQHIQSNNSTYKSPTWAEVTQNSTGSSTNQSINVFSTDQDNFDLWRTQVNYNNGPNVESLGDLIDVERRVVESHIETGLDSKQQQSLRQIAHCDQPRVLDRIDQLKGINHKNATDKNTSSVRSMLNIRSNQCNVCGRLYARPSTLKTHLRTHTNERPFKCTVCSKTFSQAANLTAHQRVHTGERPFSCPICSRQFSQSSSVITHLRTHSGERPYRCAMCSRTFSDSSTLTKHVRIHSGEKPYKCHCCPLNFSQSGNLSRHLKLHMMASTGNGNLTTSVSN